MPHSYLKVVGNLGYRCNNSSPRYSVRTTMPSLYPNLKISYVFKYKISITLLLFLVCFGESYLNPLTKVEDFSDKFLSPNVFICFWSGI